MGSSGSNGSERCAFEPNTIVEELRSWCEERGVSQSSLAMEIGVSVSHLNQVINGRARPSAELTQRIAEVLERRKTRRTNNGRPV